MVTTPGSIASEVFDAVSAEIPSAIKAITFVRKTKGAYDTTAGTYTETETQATARGIAETETAKVLSSDFPNYTAVGNETLWLVAEPTASPAVNDAFSAGDYSGRVVAIRDMLETGTLFRVVVVTP